MTLHAGQIEDGSFLVEHYLPGKRRDELETLVGSIRAAVAALAGADRSLRLLHATVVPEDQSVLCVIAATSEQMVRRMYGRAGLDFDRISTAIAAGPAPDSDPHRPTENPKGSRNAE